MDILITIIALGLFLWMTLGPLAITMHKKRVVSNTYDKSIVYLASEFSFTPDNWNKIKDKIDYEKPKNIIVPFKTIWAGIYGRPFTSFGQVGSIWHGLLFLALFVMIGFGKSPLKLFAADIMNFLLILGLGLCWFFYNFRSFAADISDVSQRSDIALSFLIDLGWENIDEELIDTLKEEVKVDFDLYKKDSSINGIVLLLISSTLLFYSRISDMFSTSAVISFVFIFASIFLSKWLYESYRSRLIEISLNTVLGLKKNIQLKNANKKINKDT
ncbi:hypothetical protein [Shewanella sp. SR44-3]|uniref:hypothetical protein n=1 Tax=Shewanella sp. SR44-3 TaxID=2760936 RepID=UPI0015F8E7CE|nr:hypothetical protein [Shewanella sp. SR44-3]MBB1271134.1 hypothetical protein [Shewanella sp. SR44-3]